MIESELLSIRIFLVKVLLIKNWSRQKLVIDYVLKTNAWMYQIKD